MDSREDQLRVPGAPSACVSTKLGLTIGDRRYAHRAAQSDAELDHNPSHASGAVCVFVCPHGAAQSDLLMAGA